MFPAYTGGVEDGLQVARYLQGDSRFIGFEAKSSLRLHPYLWLSLDGGYVDAELAGGGPIFA